MLNQDCSNVWLRPIQGSERNKKAFPELKKTVLSEEFDETSEDYKAAIREAVNREPKRLWKKKNVKQAQN